MKENTTDSIEELKENDKQAVIDLESTELIFEMRVGKEPESRNLADTRRAIQLFELANGEYLYRVSDQNTGYYEFGGLPPHDVFVQDSRDWIDFSIGKGRTFDESYEFSVVNRDTDVKTVDLRRKIESDIEETLKSGESQN